jgi:hypothetical protein
MFVNAGFILGFDSEKAGVAEGMAECIEATSIPLCMVGLLYALPNTQLTRRLQNEGRLFAVSYTERMAAQGGGDQCTSGLNFTTARPRRDILADYRAVLGRVYDPAAYFARVRGMVRMLERPVLDRSRSADPVPRRIAGISAYDLRMLWRLVRRLAFRQPAALVHFFRTFYECVRRNPAALRNVGILTALYLHAGPFSRHVMAIVDRQIAEIDAGRWQPGDLAERAPGKVSVITVA